MKTVSVAFILLAVIPSLLLATDSTYYYVKLDMFTNGILEMIETTSDSSQKAPDGFTAKTIQQIHNLGYMTPSESYAAADPNDIDEDVSDGNTWATWFVCETNGGTKRVYGASRTGKSWAPGYIYLLARNACLNNPNPPIWVRTLHQSDSTYYKTWGYNTQWSQLRQYSSGSTYNWSQKGWHKWSDDGTVEWTNKSKSY